MEVGSADKNARLEGFIKKPPIYLVPKAFIFACARALGFGAVKYEANNWRLGMKWSETYSAVLRHLVAWQEGEDTDPESGLSHLDHACAMLAFLTEYAANPAYAGLDDRWRMQEQTASLAQERNSTG